MTGELGDASKVDPANIINVTYEDLSEEQRLKFEADLECQNEEIKATSMLWEDTARRDREGDVRHAIDLIYYTTTACSSIRQCKFFPSRSIEHVNI